MTTHLRELADLLHELREAGWVRTVEWSSPPRDLDGAPETDDCAEHTWSRGVATIMLPRSDNRVWTFHCVTYDLGYGDETGHVVIGPEWIEQRGIAALRKLAEAAGVIGADLYPPTCTECGGGGATAVPPGLGVSECGGCGGAGVDLPARFHNPHVEAVPA